MYIGRTVSDIIFLLNLVKVWLEIQDGLHHKTVLHGALFESIIKFFFSDTTDPFESKLICNVLGIALYKTFVFCLNLNSKMAVIAGHWSYGKCKTNLSPKYKLN